MATTKSAAVKAKKEETIEVSGVDIEVDPVEVEPVTEAPKRRNILLHRFTDEDLYNRNPEIYERLYKTFEPMGIAGNQEEIASLIQRYYDWYKDAQQQIEAEKKQKLAEAQEQIRKMAEKAGLKISIEA